MEAAEEEAPREAPSTYEHACMRAELLGLARPTMEEYEASRSTIRSANYDEDELEELERQRQQEAEAAADASAEAELVEVQLTVSGPRLSASSSVGGSAGPAKKPSGSFWYICSIAMRRMIGYKSALCKLALDAVMQLMIVTRLLTFSKSFSYSFDQKLVVVKP